MRLNPSFYKYFFVALAGLIIDFGTLVFVKEVLGLNYLFAACAGFMAGLIVNYLLSNRFVFKDPKIGSKSMNFVLFGIIGLIGLGLLNVLMWLQVDKIGVNYIIAKVIATIFVYIWNYAARASLYHDEK
jgi:putative flippase GtrA